MVEKKTPETVDAKKKTDANATEKEKITPKPKTEIAAKTSIWDVVIHPSLSEKSIANVEAQNKVVFIVKRTATKAQIKQAVESAFGVKVQDVNTLITPKGIKRAYVRLAPDYLALDIATKLGMM